MKENNWYRIDCFLNIDNSYSYIEELDHNPEIKEFVVGLFNKVDEFNNANKQPNNEMNKAHLMEIKKYICENDGISYKLARDLQIELDNLDSDLTKHTDYYQDLLKLRAAMKVDE